MLAVSMLSWWYGQGWAQVLGSLGRRLQKTINAFSVGTLLRTLFAPWRRIISAPGKGISGHLYAALDNLVSRVIGFIVRLFVLIAAILMLATVLIISVIELVIWPLLPVALVICLIEGLVKL